MIKYEDLPLDHDYREGSDNEGEGSEKVEGGEDVVDRMFGKPKIELTEHQVHIYIYYIAP